MGSEVRAVAIGPGRELGRAMGDKLAEIAIAARHSWSRVRPCHGAGADLSLQATDGARG
jgi:hypothetical protein